MNCNVGALLAAPASEVLGSIGQGKPCPCKKSNKNGHPFGQPFLVKLAWRLRATFWVLEAQLNAVSDCPGIIRALSGCSSCCNCCRSYVLPEITCEEVTAFNIVLQVLVDLVV